MPPFAICCKEMLTRAGYQTVFAVDNGRALVSQCQAHRPDVVIADINMPDLDGLDAAAAIYQDAPVPIISGLELPRSRVHRASARKSRLGLFDQAH